MVGGATYINQPSNPTIKVKPQPQTWVHMAQTKWSQQNKASTIPSYSESGPSDSET